MNQLISKLDFNDIVPNLSKGIRLFFCGPGITPDIGRVLYELAKEKTDVFVVCDLDAQNDYRGLNDIEELNKLFSLPNVTMKHSKGINVSFISNFMDFNYFLFPVSKIFKERPEGYNAVMFSGLIATTLFGQFFPELISDRPDEFRRIIKKQKEIEQNKLSVELKNINNIVDKIKGESLGITSITQIQIKKIQRQVREFPPEKPDLKRKVDFINVHIQVADLKFEGANWQAKRVTIPQKLIPFKSDLLRKNLDSKLKIFSKDDENKSLMEFTKLKRKVDDLRKAFLFRSKIRNKSIIKTIDKREFKAGLDTLSTEVKTFQDSLFILVKNQISIAKERIRNELIEFYKANPDNNMKNYEKNFEEMIADEVDSLMRHIQFPKVSEIIGELDLSFSFLNFTYEDF